MADSNDLYMDAAKPRRSDVRGRDAATEPPPNPPKGNRSRPPPRGDSALKGVAPAARNFPALYVRENSQARS